MCTGISLDAAAISRKQEVQFFPVSAVTALAYILPKAIRVEQAHSPKALLAFCLTLLLFIHLLVILHRDVISVKSRFLPMSKFLPILCKCSFDQKTVDQTLRLKRLLCAVFSRSNEGRWVLDLRGKKWR